MNRLNGKTAVITGGATGIGRALAKAIARNGIEVPVAATRDPKGFVPAVVAGSG